MLPFFTSVGFQSDFKVLKKGGKPLLVMIGLVTLLIVVQNILSVGMAKALRLSPLIGMAAGSIPMSGGHGTAGGFAPVLESMGLQGADSITLAAATFGLVAGSLVSATLIRNIFPRKEGGMDKKAALGSIKVIQQLGYRIVRKSPYYCRECGETVEYGMKYCPECGAKLGVQ